jgi:S1-C subfamily serine protease
MWNFISRALVCLVASFAVLASGAGAGDPAEDETAARTLIEAVVMVEVRALADARSTATISREREGSGVVIDEQGDVLTIGYLAVEAESITITTSRGQAVPAQLAGYDHATGLALLRALAPLNASPLPLGDSASLREGDPVMALPFGGHRYAQLARVTSRRAFDGNWEYLLDEAIFTAPPTLNWSGAALVNRDMKLVGVGSLLVRDAIGNGDLVPGNLFVPIDLLKPILADLRDHGRRAGPARPWLGLGTEELPGHLIVARVSADGPADRAGIRRGDLLLAVGATPIATRAEFYRRVWALGSAGVAVPLRILRGATVFEVSLLSIDPLAYFRMPPTH